MDGDWPPDPPCVWINPPHTERHLPRGTLETIFMKKIIAGAAGAIMLSAGLVASASTAAHADPYPGTVATQVTITAPAKVKRKKQATICAAVTPRTGTAQPVGTLTITVTKNSNSKVITQGQFVNYAGGTACVTTYSLKKVGGYTARATYVSRPGTVFNDSSNSVGFDVVKKKKRRN